MITGLLAGLRETSWTALGLAGVQALVWLGLGVLAFDADHVRQHGGAAVAFSGQDDFAYATARALDLAARSDPDPVALLLGASCTREGFSGQDGLQAAFRAAGARSDVIWLATLEQTLWESASLADLAPAGTKGVAIVGVGAARFAFPERMLAYLAAGHRIGVPHRMLDAEARRRGISPWPEVGVYGFDHWAFVRPRLWTSLVNAVHGPIPQQPHQYDDVPGVTFASQKADAPDRLKWIRTYEAQKAEGYRFLEEAVGVLRARGIDVVFLHGMHNTAFYADQPEAHATLDAYRAEIAAFAGRLQVPIWDLDEQVTADGSSFYDGCHLRDPAARLRFDAALAERVAAWEASQ